MKVISSTAITPLAIVALLAGLTFWLESATNPEDPARKALKRHDPDYIISQMNVRLFDAEGGLKQAMLADTMTHYPDDDSSLITKPQLTYYQPNQNTLVYANTAQVSHDNKQVFMQGDVRLIKPAREAGPETVMQTEALTVFPDDDIAQGNTRVTITRGNTVVSGDGIHYNGHTSVTVLAGRVKGIFPRTKKS